MAHNRSHLSTHELTTIRTSQTPRQKDQFQETTAENKKKLQLPNVSGAVALYQQISDVVTYLHSNMTDTYNDYGIMVIISVVDVLNGERFRFPVAQDCYFKVKHLKYEMSLMNRRATDARYLIIREGEVLDDEEYLVPYGYVAVSTPTQRNPVLEFFLMAQPKQPEKKEKAVCFLDEPSIAAAQEWMTSHGAYASEGEIAKRQHISNTLQKLLPANDNDDDSTNPQNPDNNGRGGMEGDQGRGPGMVSHLSTYLST